MYLYLYNINICVDIYICNMNKYVFNIYKGASPRVQTLKGSWPEKQQCQVFVVGASQAVSEVPSADMSRGQSSF